MGKKADPRLREISEVAKQNRSNFLDMSSDSEYYKNRTLNGQFS